MFPFFTFDSKYLSCISPFLSIAKSLLFHLYFVKNNSFISYFLYFCILFHSFLSDLLLFIPIYNLIFILFLISWDIIIEYLFIIFFFHEVIDSNKVPFSTLLHFCFCFNNLKNTLDFILNNWILKRNLFSFHSFMQFPVNFLLLC